MGLGRQPNFLDVVLFMNRQRLVLEMHKTGKIDADEAVTLFEATSSSAAVESDAIAAERGNFGPETASGLLGLHFFKRKGKE